MLSKEKALKISIRTLAGIAIIDIIRGIMHTFFIMFASENIAHMTQTADTLFLMNAFGIANLLSGLTYLLIVKKAKELSPYLLGLIPTVYVLGIISNKMNGIVQESAWNGQYIMIIYLSICALVSLNYFIASKKDDKNQKL